MTTPMPRAISHQKNPKKSTRTPRGGTPGAKLRIAGNANNSTRISGIMKRTLSVAPPRSNQKIVKIAEVVRVSMSAEVNSAKKIVVGARETRRVRSRVALSIDLEAVVIWTL